MALHKQIILIDLAYVAYSYMKLILQPTPLTAPQISETSCSPESYFLKLNSTGFFLFFSTISRFEIFSGVGPLSPECAQIYHKVEGLGLHV